MLRTIISLFLLSILITPRIVSAEPSSPPLGALVGTWEARYKTAYDGEQLDVLTIVQTGQKLFGTYRGYEEEDYGPWYYFVRVQQLMIEEDGTISITIGPRNIYAWRPTSVDEMSDRSGGTRPGTGRYETSFRLLGSLGSDGSLYLGCSPQSQSCSFGNTRVFSKRRN
jgi:hypothetical protein